MTYNTNAGNNSLCPRIICVLYIRPNNDGNGHLIYKLSTDQILVTMKYQSVPLPEDLIKAMNKTDSSDNKIQVNHSNGDHSIVQDNHSNITTMTVVLILMMRIILKMRVMMS